MICDGSDDLCAEGFVNFVVGTEDGASGGMDAVEFGDLVGGEAGGMLADGGWVDGRNEGNVRVKGVLVGFR